MLHLSSRSDARALYQYLREADYTEKGLIDAVGTAQPFLPGADRIQELAAERSALHSLIRCFFFGEALGADAAGLLPEWFVDTCIAVGLIEREDGAYTPTALIVPYSGLLLAADRFQRLQSPKAYDYVQTISPVSRHLLKFMVRKPYRRVLDLCTGFGIHALAAAPRCEQVVATDLNPRATMYAEFNARLNGFDNVECRTGSLFEPVAGERFDLIVSNPPFILAPGEDFLYRDNQMGLDRLCGYLVEEAADHLSDGGIFQMICEWAQIKGEDWQDRLREWFNDIEGLAWIIKANMTNASTYVENRLKELPSTEQQLTATRDEWLRYFHDEQVEKVHGGLIAVQRRAGPSRVQFDEVKADPPKPYGDVVLQHFETQAFLEGLEEDSSLLRARLRVSPRTILNTHSIRQAGGWVPTSMELGLNVALGEPIALQPAMADLIGQFDGTVAVQEHVSRFAGRLDIDPEGIAAQCVRVVKLLLERGILVPG